MASEKRETIERLCARLGQRNPLRVHAMMVLSDPNASIDDVQPVLRALLRPAFRCRQERGVASWLIERAAWTEAQRTLLSATLSRAVERTMRAQRRYRTQSRWFGRGLTVSALLCLLGGTYHLLYRSSNVWRPAEFNSLQISVTVFSFSVVLLLICRPLSLSSVILQWKLRHLRPVVEALGQLGQPACILSIGMASACEPLQDAATTALVRIAANLRPEDYGTLPQECVPLLCEALTLTTSPETVSALLRALAVIGDGRAIRAVEKLAVTDTAFDDDAVHQSLQATT